ncbi:MAG: O-antigen ligase family protein [Gammaproteobacteria bacterium]
MTTDQRGAASTSQGRGWVGLYFVILYLLTLPALKLPLGVDVRVGQVMLLVGFIVLWLHDLVRREVPWGILLGLVGFGALLSGISLLSLYPKVKEVVFIIKYVVLYPATFYLGYRLLGRMTVAQAVWVLEATLFVACVTSIFLHYYPVSFLIHERPAYLSVALKGSFWEQGSLAFFLALFFITALALRIGQTLWPRNKFYLLALYGLALSCALASRNKSVWLALGAAFLLAGFLNPGAVTAAYRFWDRAKTRSLRRWGQRFLVLVAVLIPALALYDASLEPEDKIVTFEMLEHKWQSERGAALRTSIDLIAEDPWLGKGFGFVEAYFGKHEEKVIGLGEGVGEIFNSFLDVWLAVGVLGLVFSLGLVALCFDRRSLVAVMAVSYLFVWANLNPVATSEYYYFFLGLCYAAARSIRAKRDLIPVAAS